MRRVLFVLALMLCFGVLGHAQDVPAYPTLALLENVDVPPRDRVALAREILGVTDIPAPPSVPVEHAVGERRLFTVNDNAANIAEPIEAELYALGEHIAIWVDTRATGSRERAATLAHEFDTVIYPKVRALWGSERTPGIDGDPRIVALFTYDISAGVAAFYASEHSLPRAVAPDSNEAEMMIYNLGAYGAEFDIPAMYSVTSHEFQHMIRDNLDSNAETWLNEGMSVFTEWMMGYDATATIFAEYFFQPRTQLNSWHSSGANYGTAALFVTYFFQRFGTAGITALSQADGLGMALVDSALADIGADENADTLFADWAAANWLQDPVSDPRWGYPTVDGLIEPASRTVSPPYPQIIERVDVPYSTDYVKLADAPRGHTLTFTAAFDPDARLIPIDAENGDYFWTAVREDESAPTLTRAFDLREVSTAALNYRVWYALEPAYDFGYVMVSTDNGQTWEVLQTANTRGTSLYGAGYTDVSIGWLDESVSLDAYIGREILVRFMVITDDALTSPGLALDDIHVDTLGYTSDFEADDGGWEARGWIRTDNRLPARVWIQVLQDRNAGADVQRILADNGDTLSAFIYDDADSVALVLSPVVPLSTEGMRYTVTVESD